MRRIIVGLVIGCLSLAALAVDGVGSARAGNSAPRDLELPVAIGLKRDDRGLARAARARSEPGLPVTQAWATPAQLANRYGAPVARANRVFEKLNQAGFVGAIDPTRGFIIGSMSVAEANRFFATEIVVIKTGAARVAQPRDSLSAPDSISADTSEIVGLTAQINTRPRTPITPDPNPVNCPPLISQSAAARTYYGMDNYAPTVDGGVGVRLALLEIEQTSLRALAVYRQCYRAPIPPVTVYPVDSTPPAVFPSTAQESTLDIIAASLIAPQLSGIDIYQFNPYSSIAFPLAAAVAASYQSGGAQIISTSVGFCESAVSDAQIQISEWILAAGAYTGVTVIAATGDSGSSACAPDNTDAAAQYPASSPLVTAVGGTQFKFQNDDSRQPIVGEEVWKSSVPTKQAGGGSRASRLSRPAYQKNIDLPGGRVIPDVAFIAAPSSYGAIPVCNEAEQCTMEVVGGTSVTAPSVAAALADMVQALSAGLPIPRRIGLLNPTLYALARQSPGNKIFRDITVGNNDLYGVQCCRAQVDYDAASGLGSLKLDEIFSLLGNSDDKNKSK